MPASRARALAQVYRHFGEVDAAETSPLYERLHVGAAIHSFSPPGCGLPADLSVGYVWITVCYELKACPLIPGSPNYIKSPILEGFK